MPAPTSSQIQMMAKSALSGAGLRGENIPDLEDALGQVISQALAMFAATGMVAPGTPAAVDPMSGSGSTAGPGMLLLAGGPTASQIEGLANAALTSKGLNGDQRGALAKVIASATAQAIALFTTSAQVSPGTPIAGFTTTAPGSFIGAAPSKPMLQPIVLGLTQAEGLRGENAPDLASAIAETLGNALNAFMTQVKIAPGIPCTPAATAGPGRMI